MRRRILVPAVLLGAVGGGMLVKRLWLEKYRQQKEELNRAEQERDLLHTWLLLELRGAQVSEYFIAHHYHSVAVFGMGPMGRRMADALGELTAYGVELDNLGAVHERLTVYRLGDDPLPPADCMVICDAVRAAEKEKTASQEFPGQIISLGSVMDWLLEQYSVGLNETVWKAGRR